MRMNRLTRSDRLSMRGSARRVAWLAVFALSGASVQAQPPSSGDVFNGGDNSSSNGPSTTNQPGMRLGGGACQTRDPECGGTNRECYNELYHSTAIVISIARGQELYRETQGQIFYSCGVCGTNEICWPRPGYQDLIAGGDGGPGNGTPQNQSSGEPDGGPMGDTMRTVVAHCGRVLEEQGNLKDQPGCESGSVLDWCRRFQQNNPTCIAIVADSGTTPNITGVPSRVDNGQVIIPAGADDAGGGQPGSNGNGAQPTNSPYTPEHPQILIGGEEKDGYWSTKRPFYNGHKKGWIDSNGMEHGGEDYTIDVQFEQGNVHNPRDIKDSNGNKRIGIIEPHFDDSRYMDYMMLQIKQKLDGPTLATIQLAASNRRLVSKPNSGPFRGY